MQFSTRIILVLTTLVAASIAMYQYFGISFAFMIVIIGAANLFVFYHVFISKELRSETDQGCWILVAIIFAICGLILSICLKYLGF